MLPLAAIVLTAATPPAASVSLPHYGIGDAFVFTGGRVEWLRGIEGDRLIWSGLGGNRFTRDANPVVPILRWRLGGVDGERRVTRGAAELWPLRRGRSARFAVVTTLKLGHIRQRSVALWRCGVAAPRMAHVPAGDFAAWRISCERYSPVTMNPVELITWDWSDEVGHYVRRQSANYATGERSSFTLVAALRGDAATEARLRALAKDAATLRPERKGRTLTAGDKPSKASRDHG